MTGGLGIDRLVEDPRQQLTISSEGQIHTGEDRRIRYIHRRVVADTSSARDLTRRGAA